MDWNEGEDWFEVRQDSVEAGRGKGREKEGGGHRKSDILSGLIYT